MRKPAHVWALPAPARALSDLSCFCTALEQFPRRSPDISSRRPGGLVRGIPARMVPSSYSPYSDPGGALVIPSRDAILIYLIVFIFLHRGFHLPGH